MWKIFSPEEIKLFIAIDSFFDQVNSSFVGRLLDFCSKINSENQGNSTRWCHKESPSRMEGNLFFFRRFPSSSTISSSHWLDWKAIGRNLSALFPFSGDAFGNKSSYNATTNKLLSVNFISFVTVLILCHEYLSVRRIHHAVTRSICSSKYLQTENLLIGKR